MESFEEVADNLISLSASILNLNTKKTLFAKSINYQITQFFELLGSTSQHTDIIKIEEKSLTRPLSPKQSALLVNLKNRPKVYLTPEDICDYLHISRHNIKRTNGVDEIRVEALEGFFNLLEEEESIVIKMKEILQGINLESWFGEVDFFSNGYIDTSALFQFLVHYGSKNIEEYNSLLLIRVIKQHSHSDKMFIQDIRDFLEDQKQLQSSINFQEQQNHGFSPSRALSQRENQYQSLCHKKQGSQEVLSFKNIEQKSSFLSKSNINPPLTHSLPISQEHLLGNKGQLMKQLEEEDFKDKRTYEERLVSIHPRNNKYISSVKKQMEGVIPFCRLEVQSHLKQLVSRVTQEQLLSRIKLLGSLFNKKRDAIKRLLMESKFTFLNAFELLDRNQNNKVSRQEWLQFILNYKVTTTNKRALLFFNSLTQSQGFNYSNFLKIFKMQSCREEYQLCEKRCPLIYESWNSSLTQQFCTFMTIMMKCSEEEDSLLYELRGRKEEVRNIEERGLQGLEDLLGQEFRSFLTQFFQKRAFEG